jgi:hypothetical protein
MKEKCPGVHWINAERYLNWSGELYLECRKIPELEGRVSACTWRYRRSELPMSRRDISHRRARGVTPWMLGRASMGTKGIPRS